LIVEGVALVQQAWASDQVGPYAVQAAIAAAHATAINFDATDWVQIVGLYDLLLQAAPSPVIEMNRAAAVVMRDGPEAGLALMDAILARGDLASYHSAHLARADVLRRLGRTAEARLSYQRALDLVEQVAERRFIERRLSELAD
jgi:RNA polymerase sigma-70 factor (ECF subfamily)